MKNVFKAILLTIAISFSLTSCDGEDGRDGIDAVNIVGTTYELGGIDFTTGNNYSLTGEIIPEDIEVLESDVVVVYRLVNVDPTVGEIWEPLPQTHFVDQGIFQFSYDFSIDDVNIYLTADFDLDTFNDTSFTNDQIFRFVVVPADFSSGDITIDSAKVLESMSTMDVIKLN